MVTCPIRSSPQSISATRALWWRAARGISREVAKGRGIITSCTALPDPCEYTAYAAALASPGPCVRESLHRLPHGRVIALGIANERYWL